ncbi:Peptidase S24-like [Fibrobacter sp. UWH5]|uniref:S24/S26 family peptidase n=1 Tax=Fibrobacter sp. UWH5 TaxID=1896211 RepID=UPI000923AA2A|nr:S24/S26 family peptidase [Fibrobacter sp. UWH5]SHL61114.1 Peptidase S24-like [Fibrobacter sp. UWH5]
MNITDEVIIAEAIRLVESGVSVTFPVNGRSMLPFIVGGREKLVLVKPENLKVGHVVLAFVEGNRYVVHRIVKISGENVTLMGDGNLAFGERCQLSDVKAQAIRVVDEQGRHRSLISRWSLFCAKLWALCLPIRRYLLKIYLITHKV